MEMQSVADKLVDRMLGLTRRQAARRCVGLACLAYIALPHLVAAQDLSANARLLAAARTAEGAGVTKALADGASPDARNRVGETALIIALKNDQPALARTMIDAGTDVNLAAVSGVTPLMAAAHAGQVEIVRMLLAKGADVAPLDRLQKNAMVYAAGQGSTDVVVLLLRAGVDPNAIYVHDLTALMWAAGYGKAATAQALLAAGARPELKDDRGKTALDIARDGNFVETVMLLEPLLRR